ncbi:MAG: response regulator transcription factor [Fuerstiella sp.]
MNATANFPDPTDKPAFPPGSGSAASPAPASADTPKLVIAQSTRLNAEAIAWCLSAYGVFRDVQSVCSAADVHLAIKSQRPGLVLLGERIVTEGAREILSELAVRMGETRIAVFGDDLTDRQLDLIVNNRITGLLSRQESMRNLNEQLLRIMGGTPTLSPQLTDRVELLKNGKFQCRASSHLKRLTDRQWDVLLRIAEGRRVSEVASDLHISAKAVESHKYRIMKTIGATDRVGLCRWAIREGLIDA